MGKSKKRRLCNGDLPVSFTSIKIKQEIIEDSVSDYGRIPKNDCLTQDIEIKKESIENQPQVKDDFNYFSQNGRKNLNGFSCAISCSDLSAMAILNKHLESHSEKNPFACEQCCRYDHFDDKLEPMDPIESKPRIFKEAKRRLPSENGSKSKILKENKDSCDSKQKARTIENKSESESKSKSKPCKESKSKNKPFSENNNKPKIVGLKKVEENIKKSSVLKENNHVVPELNRFTCKFCERSFHRRINFKEHMASHSEGDNIHCKLCNKSFVYGSCYRRHLKIHNGEKLNDRPEVICPICNKTFHGKIALSNHMRRHPGSVLYKSCSICNKLFKGQTALTAHLTSHESEALYKKCKICNKYIRGQNGLLDHMKTHKVLTQYTMCHVCNKCFQGKSALNKHMKQAHYDVKGRYNKKTVKVQNFKCQFCKRNFNSKIALAIHVRVHETKKPLTNKQRKDSMANRKCSLCDKKFKGKQAMNAHMRFHKKPVIKYEILTPTIKSKAKTANNHKKPVIKYQILSPTKTSTKHQADIKKSLKAFTKIKTNDLKKSLQKLSNLKLTGLKTSSHKLSKIKLTESKKTCPVCQKIFKSKLALKKHLNIHADEEARSPSGQRHFLDAFKTVPFAKM